MSPLLDVRAIAHLIADSAADEEKVFERIRHWTRERLLVTAQGMHPGTGYKRLYDPSVVQTARVLNLLTELGVSMRTLELFTKTVDTGTLERQKTQFGEDVFLVIEKFRHLEERKLSLWHRKDHEQGRPIGPDVDAVILVKL
jgi:DNA-binding transcriptional MerR regulator